LVVLTNAKPDAHAKKYLAVVGNYCSTKTTHLQVEHKYTTKAKISNITTLRISVTQFKFTPNWTKIRRQLIIKWT